MTELEIYELIRPDNIDKWQVEDAARAVETLRALLDQGNGVAGYCLFLICDPYPGSQAVKNYLRLPETDQVELLERSFPLLLAQAENDNVDAMGILSQYYQCGYPPVERDADEMRKWNARCTDWSRRHGEM